MGESLTEKAKDMGQKISDTATKVGHRVGEKLEEAGDWAKETAHKIGNRVDEAMHGKESCSSDGGTCGTAGDIKEHMDVIASCGTKVGKVDHVQGGSIRLTKNDSPDGMHHMIPGTWVDHVDKHVHLNKNSVDAMREWQPA